MNTKYIRSFIPMLALAVAAGACSTKDNASDSLAVDTSLNRDLALANRDSAAQPQLNDVPSGTGTTRTGTTSGSGATKTTTTKTTTTTTPKATTPSTTSSGNKVTTGSTGAGGAVGTLPSGTTLYLASNSRICTNTNKVGDTFTATLNNAVSSGGVTIPAGSQVKIEVTSLKRSENSTDNITMGFRVLSVNVRGTSYPIDGTVAAASSIEKVRNQSTGKDVQKVATGAVLGAIAGQVIGKNTKGTVIGAAAGAAAGTAAAVATANFEGCLPSGGALSVTTTAPAQIKL
jgi:YmgG-like glycine-zipper protein